MIEASVFSSPVQRKLLKEKAHAMAVKEACSVPEAGVTSMKRRLR